MKNTQVPLFQLMDEAMTKLDQEVNDMIANEGEFRDAVRAAVSTIEDCWNIGIAHYGLSYPLVIANSFRVKLVLKETLLAEGGGDPEIEGLITEVLLETVVTIVLSMLLPTPGFAGLYEDAAFARLAPLFEDLNIPTGVHLLTRITNDISGIEIALVVQGTQWVSRTLSPDQSF